MCRTLLLLSLTLPYWWLQRVPDDLPPPSDSAPGKIPSWIRSLRPMLKLAGGQISAQIPKTTSTSFIAMSTTVTSSMRTAIQRGLEQRARRCCGSGRQIRKYGGCTNRRDPRRLLRPDSKYLRYAKRSLDGTWTKSNIVWGLEVGMASETVLDQREHPTSFTIAQPDFSFTRLQMQRTLPNGINTSCTKHSADSLHASHPSSMVRPFGFPTSIGISAKLHSTREAAFKKSEKVYDRIYYKGQQSGVAKSARIYRWATPNIKYLKSHPPSLRPPEVAGGALGRQAYH